MQKSGKSQLKISAWTLTNALGLGSDASLQGLQERRSGLRANDLPDIDLQTAIGRIDGIEETMLPEAWQQFDCRNNRLALLGLQQDDFMAQVEMARAKYREDRIGIFMGTSTSGIQEAERAFAHFNQNDALPVNYDYWHSHNLFSLADFVSRVLNLSGPAQVISTACSSSAKVFAAADRHIKAGFCDAAIVGGVDSLCQMTLYGFNSLQLVSGQPCRPADKERDGISIGEAAGYALLEPVETDDHASLRLLGYGESSDAYHISSPHPEGKGARLAMQQALEMADVSASTIDYVNLHGTATPANDASEDKAVLACFGAKTPCSSTKGWTGHTLGAAGITEALFACLCIENDFIPGSLNTSRVDPDILTNIVMENRSARISRVMTNSFGFGGSNCSLLLGKES